MRPENLHYIFSPVTRLKSVGPALAAAIARLSPIAPEGVPVIRELLFHMPTGLLDRRKTYPLRETPPGVIATFIVTVEAHDPPPRNSRGKKPYKVRCSNETGDLTLVFFNASADYLLRALPIGQTRVVSGMTEHFEYRLQMTHPDIIAPLSQIKDVQVVEPVYPLTAGLTHRRLAGIIRQALVDTPVLPEWIPGEVLAKNTWQGWNAALGKVHSPMEESDLLPGTPERMRLAFDEAFASQLHLARLKSNTRRRGGRVIAPPGKLRQAVLERLPFTLTDGQKQAIAQIDADIASGERMARLLQGDVGSGKTIVALFALLSAVEAGFQAAMMVPTELIAQQHARNFQRLCEGLGVNVVLLTGSVQGRAREEALSMIATGDAHIVLGTHALFQDSLLFANLALVVVDEQHRFGVAQRTALSKKADEATPPHLLQMTATPIPRSLAMTVYGHMDSTWLIEKPAGRQKVETRVIPLSRFEEVAQRLEPALARGEKIYWVCPMIEDDSLNLGDAAAVEERYKLFRKRFGDVAGMVHGRMKAEDRDAQMRRFAEGACRLLVATTVVEVGVDVPDATVMVIEQAERFGLAQLHQLRGRVGRSDKASSCVLLYSDAAGEEARVRLATLRESHDGLVIAEADLKARGGGDVLGTRQSGLPAFRFLSLSVHYPLIEAARAQAEQIVGRNPQLSGDEGNALQTLLGLFGYPV